jgi:hypothetical protein
MDEQPESMRTEVSATDAPAPEAVEANVSGEESRASGRPFRVKLRGSVLALLRLPNRRDVRAAIHQLSTTGGVVNLEKPLDEKIEVQMVFHMGGATIRAKAQMLFPMWATQGWMQPFRFVELPSETRESLDANLKALVGEKVSTAAAGA